jgi:hypothetical protein
MVYSSFKQLRGEQLARFDPRRLGIGDPLHVVAGDRIESPATPRHPRLAWPGMSARLLVA